MTYQPSKEVLELRKRLIRDIETNLIKLAECRKYNHPEFKAAIPLYTRILNELRIQLQCVDLVLAGANGDLYRSWQGDPSFFSDFANYSELHFQDALTIKDE